MKRNKIQETSFTVYLYRQLYCFCVFFLYQDDTKRKKNENITRVEYDQYHMKLC